MAKLIDSHNMHTKQVFFSFSVLIITSEIFLYVIKHVERGEFEYVGNIEFYITFILLEHFLSFKMSTY